MKIRGLHNNRYILRIFYALHSKSLMPQTWFVMPASIAGMTRRDECTHIEIIVGEMQADSGFQVQWLPAEAFVSRVNLRSCILIVKFCLSTKLVEM
jgi:hypothetical protein